MYTKLQPCLLVVVLLLIVNVTLSGETFNGVEIKKGQWKGQDIEYLDREILVGLKAGKSPALFYDQIENYQVQVVRTPDRFGFLKIQISENENLFEIIEKINALPSVEYAEPNMIDRLLAEPDDPMFNEQWHYHNIGQNPPGGTVDADIDAPEGWDISTGQSTIIVGVLDSGIPMQGGSLSHPDLDDPVRYLIGENVISPGSDPMDDNGHGTHVSGTIAAETNNGIGVAGVAWNVKVMAIKVFDSGGSGSHEYFRDGCIYGVDNGCKVLNYSGGGSSGATKEHGVAYADSNDVVLCAAAGNNWQGSCDYPGAYSTSYDNVICVSATDHNDVSSPFSSIGPEVTVAAPGGHGSPYDEDDIISTFPNYPCYLTTNYGLPQNYGPLAGTSMATPHVAGFAGLILSMNPDLTPDSVKQIMINTADDLGPAGFDNQFGWGRINVFNALSQMGAIVINHTALENTKETIQDYEVLATIWSVAGLVSDQAVLKYDVGSGWQETNMTATGNEDEYQGFIPAQQSGTWIDYYIFAEDLDGEMDSTDVYSFYVIDYDVILDPEFSSTSAPALDEVVYEMTAMNNGIYNDEFDFTLANNTWVTEIWDATQSSQITGTGVLVPDEIFSFYVKVQIPSSYEGEYDSTILTATSNGDNSLSTQAVFKTVSAGQPWPIPYTEIFSTTTFDMTKWESVDGTEINDVGIEEPSAPYSANLNGDPSGNDVLETEKINLRDETNIIVSYFYQQTGGGESPDDGDDLIVEYLNNTASWVELNRHDGGDPDMTEFEEVELQLPGDAMHAEFRLKIRCTATSGAYDDWFVDDIYVGHPSDYKVSLAPSIQAKYGPAGDYAAYLLTITNKGFLDDNFTLTSTGDWNVIFFDETGINQITESGTITGGTSRDIIAKVEVPAGTPLHSSKINTVYVTSQGDGNISAYALVETTSAGTPAIIPWDEVFPDDTLLTQNWFTYDGVTVSTSAVNPPSPPYSINLNGGPDEMATQLVDLSNKSGVVLSYYYERGGALDPPAIGDDLLVEYNNPTGDWINLMTHPGGDVAMTEFEYVSIQLPTEAHYNGVQIRFRTVSSSGGSDWFVDDIRLDYPPEMALTYPVMSSSLVIGESDMKELEITNNGDGNLIYDIDINPHVQTEILLAELYDNPDLKPAQINHPDADFTNNPSKGEDLPMSRSSMDYSMGGPDDFGYYWIDSDEPGGPVYDWVDVSTIGTDLIDQLGDDSFIGPFDIGFDFTFYGQSYDQIFIGSNGLIGFTTSNMESRTPKPIPYLADPNAILALLWDDLDPTDDANTDMHLYFRGDPNQCVIQYQNYPEYRAGEGDIFSGEIILYPDGRIKFQYKEIAEGFDIFNCAVGIEDHNGVDGLEVCFREEYLHDNLAIEFFKPFDWLIPDKTAGTILPGESETIQCQFVTSVELEDGIYTADLVLNTNEPGNEQVLIEAQLELFEEPPYICGDADNSKVVDISDAVYVINYVLVEGSPEPDPYESGNVNCDDVVDVSDAVYLINFIFVEGSPLPCECK